MARDFFNASFSISNSNEHSNLSSGVQLLSLLIST